LKEQDAKLRAYMTLKSQGSRTAEGFNRVLTISSFKPQICSLRCGMRSLRDEGSQARPKEPPLARKWAGEAILPLLLFLFYLPFLPGQTGQLMGSYPTEGH
jgi:hypothetical protein